MVHIRLGFPAMQLRRIWSTNTCNFCLRRKLLVGKQRRWPNVTGSGTLLGQISQDPRYATPRADYMPVRFFLAYQQSTRKPGLTGAPSQSALSKGAASHGFGRLLQSWISHPRISLVRNCSQNINTIPNLGLRRLPYSRGRKMNATPQVESCCMNA